MTTTFSLHSSPTKPPQHRPPTLRILYLGQLGEGGTCLQRMRALRDLGHDVVGVNTAEYRKSSRWGEQWYRLRNKLDWPADRAEINRLVTRRVFDESFDVLWADKALTLWPETLVELKRKRPELTIVGYSPDDMGGSHNQSRYFLQSLPHYDLYITTKSFNVAELRELGCPRVVFVAKAFDPQTHRPMNLTSQERVELGAPVGFIGGCEGARARSILSLADSGIPVRVYGDGWERLRKASPGVTVSGPSMYGDLYARIICAFDINLAFLRKISRDLQTARSIEIPACGAFMLAERTDEHLELFEEGQEAEFFGSDEELREKVRFYLDHPQARQRIAQAGRERCLRGGYSNHHRLQWMIDQIRQRSVLTDREPLADAHRNGGQNV